MQCFYDRWYEIPVFVEFVRPIDRGFDVQFLKGPEERHQVMFGIVCAIAARAGYSIEWFANMFSVIIRQEWIDLTERIKGISYVNQFRICPGVAECPVCPIRGQYLAQVSDVNVS